MNHINKRADRFVQNYISGQISDQEEVISEAKTELYNIDSDLDKTTFLRIILEENAREHKEHLLHCNSGVNCQTDYDREGVSYFLTQELNRLGIKTNNDQFSIQEKEIVESRLDKVLADLQTIKDGQQIIYEDLKAEIDSLKELFILGKKTWLQLLLGKAKDMAISGVISETVSKEIVSIVGKEFNKLLL